MLWSPAMFVIRKGDQFLRVHLGRNGMYSGRLTWEDPEQGTRFDSRDAALRFHRLVEGEGAEIFGAPNFR